MLKKEELFVLIKSLSKSEKRYFKLYSMHNNSNANYVKLFDAIEEQDGYDEFSIKHKYKGEAFVKQLHVTKNYLRTMILASLRNYHVEISKDAVLKDYLRNVEILFNKELYQLCSNELKKAEAIAEKYELYTGKLEVLSWRRKLKQAKEPSNYSAFYEIVNEQEATISVLQNGVEHWKQMILETWETMGSNPPDKKNKPNPQKALTLQSQVLQHNTAYIRYLRKGKRNNSEKELLGLIKLLESNPERLLEEPVAYVSTINNLVSYMIFSKKDDKALIQINKAKSAYEQLKLTSDKKSLLKQILRTYNLELEIYRSKKQIDTNGFEFIRNTEAFIDNNQNKMPKDYLLSFWFQLAHIYYTHKKHDSSLHFVNSILNNKFGDIRYDLQVQVRMLNLLIHFQQENYFVLRYFVDSTRRFIRKKRLTEAYEDEVLRFFSRMSTVHEYERKEHYKELYNRLFDADETLVPDGVLDFIDYKSWLEGMMK